MFFLNSSLIGIVLLLLYMLWIVHGVVRERDNYKRANGKLEVENKGLKDQLSTLRDEVEQEDLIFYSDRIESLRRHVARLKHQVNRLPVGKSVRVVESRIGTFAIAKQENGYYSRAALFVYFPIGFGFSQEVADAFRHETNNRYLMDPAPRSSDGGDDTADAIITAGLGFDALIRPRDLDEVAGVLSTIIVHPKGVTASG